MNQRTVVFNDRAIEFCGYVPSFAIDGLDLRSCKNASLKNALEFYSNTFINDAIRRLSAHIDSKYKFVLVDVKLHSLEKNDVPCIPGWHIDGGPEVESEYVLCTAGSSLTEFYTKSFELLFDGNVRTLCDELDDRIGNNYTIKMKEWQIVKYNNMVPHRGALAHTSGPRLLIRVMGSNKIMPQPIKYWQPTQYKG